MKKIYLLYIVLISLATTSLIGCSDWTESEAKTFPESIVSDEYYAALRAYKQTDHQVAFGWFGGWSGEGAYMKSSLAGIPDSVDIVSIWGNWSNITEAQKKDLEFCQQVKGTRFTMCFIIRSVGDQITPQNIRENWENMGFSSEKEAVNDFWGWPSDESNKEAIEASIRKYASAIADTVNKYGYDGFDIDYEPNFGNPGNIVDEDDRMFAFVDELGKYFGPQSGTGKLLIVDFYNQLPPKETEPYVDYFVRQCYTTGSAQSLQSKFDQLSSWCPPEKFVATEQMGWYWQNGGVEFTEADGNKVDSWGNPIYSVIGMARWNPTQGRKGGFGGYYFEYEYNTTRPANQAIGDKEKAAIPYYSLRRGIQEQNPAGKPVQQSTKQETEEENG